MVAPVAGVLRIWSLLTACFLLSLSLAAQSEGGATAGKVFSLGPFVGIDRVYQRTDINIRPSQVDLVTTEVTVPVAGLSASYLAGGRWSLLLDLGYQQMEFTNRAELYTIGEEQAYRVWKYRTQSIGIDAVVRYALGAKPYRPHYAEAGMYSEISLAGDLTREVDHPGATNSEYEGPLKGYNYGLIVGAGRTFGRADLRLRAALTDRAIYEERYASYRLGIRLAYRL